MRIDIPMATLLRSLTHPINNGITAPPEMAIIISPEISFLRAGYRSTAIEKTIGHMFAIASPIMKTSIHAITAECMRSIAIRHIRPRTDVHINKLREEILVSKAAPKNVPSIRPKK